MNNGRKVKVGIIGSQFEADIQDIHVCACKTAPEEAEAEVVAVASPTQGNAGLKSRVEVGSKPGA